MKKLRAMLAARRDQIKHRAAVQRSACEDKVRYQTVLIAHGARARRMIHAPDSPPLYIYPCRYCAGFHLTRQKKGSVA